MLSLEQRIKTSHSEVESFLLCERKHYYTYGMKIESIRESKALYRGIVGHSALAKYYEEIKNGVNHNDATRAAYSYLIDVDHSLTTYEQEKSRIELNELLFHYFLLAERTQADWEILEVEKEFVTQLTDGAKIKTIVDLIARIPGEGIIAIDHKFVYDFFNPDVVDLNPQLPKYVAVLQQQGYPVAGAMYNELRYRKLKGQDDDNTPFDWDTKFAQHVVHLTSERIVTTMREHLRIAKKIQMYKDMGLEEWESRITRVGYGMVCNMCAFKQICISDLNGEPRGMIESEFYKPRQYRN